MNRLLILPIVLSACLSFSSRSDAQIKIDYKVPKEFKKIIDKKSYRTIVDFTLREFRKDSKVIKFEAATVFFKMDRDTSIYFIDNIVAECLKEESKKQWKPLIIDKVSKIFEDIKDPKIIDLNIFASIRNYLRLRIYSENFGPIQKTSKNLYAIHEDLPGTYTVLVLSLPSGLIPVTTNQLKRWQVALDYAFQVAQENVNNLQYEKLRQSLESDIEVTLIANEDYACPYILDLQINEPELVGRFGSVISIPTKSVAVVHRLDRSELKGIIDLITNLLPFVEMYSWKQNYSISTEFYWYYGTSFYTIQLDYDEQGNIKVRPPKELLDLLY